MLKRRKVDAKTANWTATEHSTPTRSNRRSAIQNNPSSTRGIFCKTRYEMLRRHRIEGRSIVEATFAFGVSRPTFYHAQTAFTEQVSRLAAAPARAEGSPQAFRRSCPTQLSR